MVNALPEDPGSIFSTYPGAQKHQELQKRRDYCPLVTSVGHMDICAGKTPSHAHKNKN